MSYEQHCNDFALYGCPMREHYDHEFNAQYDRYDGWDCGDEWDCEPPVTDLDVNDLLDHAAELHYEDWDGLHAYEESLLVPF